MARKPRLHCTETDKALMWDRWPNGDTLEKIARLFDRSHGSVARILRQTTARAATRNVRLRNTG
jgi:hypothetical protein